MGVSSPPLICLYVAAALIGGARSEGVCLQDGKHKATPSPEPHLTECGLYADNSCCTEEHIQDISYVPSASSKNEPWDKCGRLSPECEGFLKRVSCFYRCSPDAARWPHPHRRSYIQAVPLCHSFCRDWFDACRMDLTCARNWARDPRGQNCTGTCVQYQQREAANKRLPLAFFGGHGADTFVFSSACRDGRFHSGPLHGLSSQRFSSPQRCRTGKKKTANTHRLSGITAPAHLM